MWFGDDPVLREVVVIDPRWLCTDIIGKLLAPAHFLIDKVEANRGLVDMRTLERVFEGEDVDRILLLLTRMHLCFPEDEAAPAASRMFMFPATLKSTDERPAGVWASERAYDAHFGRRLLCHSRIAMFSAGFFPKFQVRGEGAHDRWVRVLTLPFSAGALSCAVWPRHDAVAGRGVLCRGGHAGVRGAGVGGCAVGGRVGPVRAQPGRALCQAPRRGMRGCVGWMGPAHV